MVVPPPRFLILNSVRAYASLHSCQINTTLSVIAPIYDSPQWGEAVPPPPQDREKIAVFPGACSSYFCCLILAVSPHHKHCSALKNIRSQDGVHIARCNLKFFLSHQT